MKSNDLRNEFKIESGCFWLNSQDEPDIEYVEFLENKIINAERVSKLNLPDVSSSFPATAVERAYDDGYSTDGEVTFDIDDYR